MIYKNSDIERFLIEARKQKENIIPRIKDVSGKRDAAAIERVINDDDFVAEDFCRYDSDVCEQFLILMELVGIAKK